MLFDGRHGWLLLLDVGLCFEAGHESPDRARHVGGRAAALGTLAPTPPSPGARSGRARGTPWSTPWSLPPITAHPRRRIDRLSTTRARMDHRTHQKGVFPPRITGRSVRGWP